MKVKVKVTLELKKEGRTLKQILPADTGNKVWTDSMISYMRH